VAASLARANSVEDVHLYGIDAARGLRPIADLPHCGAVVSLDDMPLLMRLLKYLTGELAHRRGLPTVARSPHLLLLIDGWEAFTNAAQQPGDDTAVEAVYRLLREGATAGIHVAITAERAGIAGRLASAIENRLILRLADRADYPAAGIPANLVPDAMPPGRGVLVEGAIETQVLLLDEDPSREAGAVAAPAAEVAGGTAPSQLPRRFTPPPERIYLNELTPAPSTLIVGVDLEDGAAVPLDLAELQTFIVTGPGRSGRSTTLALLAAQLHDAGQRPVVVAIRPSPLRDCAKGRGLPLVKDRNDRSRLHDAVDSCHVVVVDDAEQVAATPVGEALDQLIRGDQDVKWLAAGAPDDLAIAYRGFIAVMRRSRCGLLLSPHGPMDGEVVGIRLMRQPIAASGSPGRGLLAIRGSATEIQVPLLP
jgi:S-DNA-T family DNA segregation ATPase FtsK/SpoIIIE